MFEIGTLILLYREIDQGTEVYSFVVHDINPVDRDVIICFFTVIFLKDGVRVVVGIIRERGLVHGRKW